MRRNFYVYFARSSDVSHLAPSLRTTRSARLRAHASTKQAAFSHTRQLDGSDLFAELCPRTLELIAALACFLRALGSCTT